MKDPLNPSRQINHHGRSGHRRPFGLEAAVAALILTAAAGTVWIASVAAADPAAPAPAVAAPNAVAPAPVPRVVVIGRRDSLRLEPAVARVVVIGRRSDAERIVAAR